MDTPGTGIFAKSEPASIYVGGELERPFAALRAAIERDEGIFLLTGESGTGKSALLAKLAGELRVAGHKVVLTTPHNNAHLIAWLSGVHLAPGTLPPVLLIDEADQLTGEDLKKLALGMRVILAGSDDLAQRVPDASRMALSRLSKEDIDNLVRHRLAALDQDKVARFPNETIAVVTKEAEGLPRNAVQITERASLIASMGNLPKVTPDHVRKAARSLGLGKEAAPSAGRQSGGIGWAAALAASSVVLALALAGGLLFLPEYMPPTPEEAAVGAPREQRSPARDVAGLPSSAPSSAPTEAAPPVPSPPPSKTTTAALPIEPPRAEAPEARDATPEPASPLPAPAAETPTAAASPATVPEAVQERSASRGEDGAPSTTAAAPETATATASPSAVPEAVPEVTASSRSDDALPTPASETATAAAPPALPEPAPEVPVTRGDDRAPPAPETATAALPSAPTPDPSEVSGGSSPIETATAAETEHEPAVSTFPPIPQRRPEAPDRPAAAPRRFVADAPIPERKPSPPVLASAAPEPQPFAGSSVPPNPYCRPYRSRVDMTGMPAEVQGLACLDVNGEWVLLGQEHN